MRVYRSIYALVFLALTAGGAQAARTYAGEEAAALRCANTLAMTAVTLHSEALISEQEKEVMFGVTFLILERHVSGSWKQKKAALEVMRDRRNLEDTLQDYRDYAAQCLRQFPIN